MAAVAKVTRVDLLNAQSEGGVVIRVTTKVRVVDLADTDIGVLATALATAGVPAYGATLTDYPELFVSKRSVEIVDEDSGTCDITVTYEQLVSDNQDFSNPAFDTVVGQVTAGIQQKESNTDIDGIPISVSHTYPVTDSLKPGETIPQGGIINYFEATRAIAFEGIRTTRFPWVIANRLIGSVNSVPWEGGAVHTWLCSRVTWRLHSRSNRYRMSFEFQHDPDTFNPTVIFIDPRDGKPPTGLVSGTGYKTVRKLVETNFESVVGVRLQGG